MEAFYPFPFLKTLRGSQRFRLIYEVKNRGISVVHLHRLLYHLILLKQRSLAVKRDLSSQYSSSVPSCKALVLIQTCCSLAAIHGTFGLLQKLLSAIWTETCPLSPLELLKRVHQSQRRGHYTGIMTSSRAENPPTKYAPNV